jgi:hypothetical protein
MNALQKQIGGSHYQKYKVQPLSWATQIGLNAAEFSVFKYVIRYKDKNGIEDLKKAKHCLEYLKELIFDKKTSALNVSDFCDINNLDKVQKETLIALIVGDYEEVDILISAMIRSFNN